MSSRSLASGTRGPTRRMHVFSILRLHYGTSSDLWPFITPNYYTNGRMQSTMALNTTAKYLRPAPGAPKSCTHPASSERDHARRMFCILLDSCFRRLACRAEETSRTNNFLGRARQDLIRRYQKHVGQATARNTSHSRTLTRRLTKREKLQSTQQVLVSEAIL